MAAFAVVFLEWKGRALLPPIILATFLVPVLAFYPSLQKAFTAGIASTGIRGGARD